MGSVAVNSKEKDVLDRIKHLEDAIAKAREFVESGKNANWHGFRPLFSAKVRDGKSLPPHRDWVKNVFLPQRQKALRQAHIVLAQLNPVASRDRHS